MRATLLLEQSSRSAKVVGLVLALVGLTIGSPPLVHAEIPTPAFTKFATNGYVGNMLSCGILMNGHTRCFGNASIIGDTSVSNATEIAVGAFHACAIVVGGSVQCWGQNQYGQVGLPSIGSSANMGATLVPEIDNAKSLALGYGYSCASLNSGEVKCWGDNTYGQLGPAATVDKSNTPYLITGLEDVVKLSQGIDHICALTQGAEVKCWGTNYQSQLGALPAKSRVSTPTLVAGLGAVRKLVLGAYYSCAILMTDHVKCWGDNTVGQLGLGSGAPSNVSLPTEVPDLSDVNDLFLGQGTSCALTRFATVKCWGQNYNGNVGISSGYHSIWASVIKSPADVPGLSNIKSIFMDPGETYAVAQDGAVYCWGTSCGLLPTIVNFFTVPGIVLQPSAPALLTINSGPATAVVNFVDNTNESYVGVSNYEYSIDDGLTWFTPSPAQTNSPIVITNLVNGATYSVKVRAVNIAGAGVESNAVTVTPQTTASRPTISSVAAGSNQASVSFTAPSDNGGADITNYEYSTDGGTTWTAVSPAQTSSPLVISGLTNGVTYSVKVRAVNSVGSGTASNAVSVKPVAQASAPIISGVVAGNGQAALSITAPSQINDSSLSGYDYSTNNGSTWSHFASVTGPFTITGLTNATAYQVKVRAVNSAGAGDASVAVAVNPTKLIPAKPVITSVVGGNASATVNITTPTDATAQSVTGYQYSINKGATYQNAVVSNGSFTVSGLTNGVSTSVQIRATNFNGNSLASVAKAVVPATTPAAPSITTITPAAGTLSIAFTAPITGGSAITSYQYSLDGGSTWVVPAKALKTSPLKVTKLPNAIAYQVKIRAVNAKGIGSASDAVSASTPVLVPSAPVTTSIAKSSTSLTVDVTAPTNNGGGSITNYAYSVDSGKTWTVVSPASNSTHIVITGLKANTTYPVQIAAINSAGRGAASAKNYARTLR